MTLFLHPTTADGYKLECNSRTRDGRRLFLPCVDDDPSMTNLFRQWQIARAAYIFYISFRQSL